MICSVRGFSCSFAPLPGRTVCCGFSLRQKRLRQCTILRCGIVFASCWMSPARDVGQSRAVPDRRRVGLASAMRDKVSAFWASWADVLPTIRERHPAIADQLCVALQRGDRGLHHRCSQCREQLIASGSDCPEWGDVARGLRPGQLSVDDPMPGARKGWQRGVAAHVDEAFRNSAQGLYGRDCTPTSRRSVQVARWQACHSAPSATRFEP